MAKKNNPIPSAAIRAARDREQAKLIKQRGGDTGRVLVDKNQPSGIRADLSIRVEELGLDGVMVHETLPQGFVDPMLEDPVEPPWRAAGDARLNLHVDGEAKLVRVRGAAFFPLRHACVRCLRDVEFDLELELDLRLAPGLPEVPGEEGLAIGDELGIDEGQMIDPDEADLVSFDGRSIPLLELLREQIFLEVPGHPACDTAGARPPEGPCTLDPEGALAQEQARWEDPRWAGLKALRGQLPPHKGDDTVH
jgi:uncharacterized metal-binding protein YceD (DUF177 family)